MNLIELDVVIKFCEKKMDLLLSNQRFMLDRKGDEFKSILKEIDFWNKIKSKYESEIEIIIKKNL